jgi:hypothetical protein
MICLATKGTKSTKRKAMSISVKMEMSKKFLYVPYVPFCGK